MCSKIIKLRMDDTEMGKNVHFVIRNGIICLVLQMLLGNTIILYLIISEWSMNQNLADTT